MVEGVRKGFEGESVLRGIDLKVEEGASLTLLGPSGCGKTTLLRVIAGLEGSDAGSVTLGSRTLVSSREFVPPEKRNIGMVFQDWALFPHLNVAANVSYGLARDKNPAPVVAGALDMVGLSGFEQRMPHTLSGGEQQRVAVARAIAPRPDAILLDEPFSNLDAPLRTEVRAETRALLRSMEMTTVFVTHDHGEAFVLGDEVAVMNRGVIHQQATPDALYANPVDPWVAGFVGDANLIAADADGHTAATPIGEIRLAVRATGRQHVLVRPEQLMLSSGTAGVVTNVEFYGHDCAYVVAVNGVELTVRSLAAPTFSCGDRVDVGYCGQAAVAYPG